MTERPNIFAEFCTPERVDWANSCFMDRAIRLLPSIVYVYNQVTQSNEYTNRSVGEVMGYTSEEVRAFGSNLMAVLSHPDDLPRILVHFKAISRLADDEVASIEYRLRHKSGHWIWFLSMDAVFNRTPGGQVERHLGVATDITELKAAEERALEASQVAEVANKDLRAFAYAISHDMKSPSNTLNLLLSELEYSHGDRLEPDARQLLDKTRETALRMQQRIERVLDYTRMIDHTFAFHPVALDVVIEDVLADMAADIAAQSAIIDVEPLPEVSGSPEELRVLFENLVGNALKFHAPGQVPRIRIFDSSHQGDPGPSVSVSDNGIGVQSGSQARIFEMFRRLHSEKDYAGAGLGLAICRRIALSHGGEISVESKEGAGACFTVRLRKPDDQWRCTGL